MFHKACVVLSFSVAIALTSGQALGGSEIARVGGHAWRHSKALTNLATAQPASNDIHFTYKLDVLWDWAHRYPPGFIPGAPPVIVGLTQPVSGDTNFTYTFDVPWDWAHRYPPGLLAGPSEPQIAPPVIPSPGCSVQEVAVGPDKKQTVTMIRC